MDIRKKKVKYKLIVFHFCLRLIFLVMIFGPFEVEGRDRNIPILQLEKMMDQILLEYYNNKWVQDRKLFILNCTQTPPIGCNQVLKNLMVNEILLRNKFKNYNEFCNDTKHDQIPLKPPLFEASPGSLSSGDDMRIRGLYDKYNNLNEEHNLKKATEKYTIWVDDMIDSGLIFCDPFKHLYCSKQEQKCKCLPGLFESNGTCLYPIGNPCYQLVMTFYNIQDIPDIPPTDWKFRAQGLEFYDPFYGHFLTRLVIHDRCCCNDASHNNKSCKNWDYFTHSPTCGDDRLNSIIIKFEKHLEQISYIGFDETCNLEQHNILHTVSEDEKINPELRFQNLESFQNFTTGICELRKLFICHPISNKCKCLEHTIYDDKLQKCTSKSPSSHDWCNHRLESNSYTGNKNTTILRQKYYEIGWNTLNSICKDNFKCSMIYNGISYCCCVPAKAGQNCKEKLTGFLYQIQPSTFPNDIEDYDMKFSIFNKLNIKIIEFEKIFKLKNGNVCNYKDEKEAENIIKRIQTLRYPTTVMTTTNYTNLMNSMDKFITSGKSLCDLGELAKLWVEPYYPGKRPSFKCNRKQRCYVPSIQQHIEDLIHRLRTFQILKLNAQCPPDIILKNEINQSYYENSNEYYEYFKSHHINLEFHWINSTKFCNRTGGLACKDVNYITKIGTCLPAPIPEELICGPHGCDNDESVGHTRNQGHRITLNIHILQFIWILFFLNILN